MAPTRPSVSVTLPRYIQVPSSVRTSATTCSSGRKTLPSMGASSDSVTAVMRTRRWRQRVHGSQTSSLTFGAQRRMMPGNTLSSYGRGLVSVDLLSRQGMSRDPCRTSWRSCSPPARQSGRNSRRRRIPLRRRCWMRSRMPTRSRRIRSMVSWAQGRSRFVSSIWRRQ